MSPWLGGLSLGSVVAFAAASNKLLSAIGGIRRKLLIAVLAILGLLVPLSAVLFAVNYLIYGMRPIDELLFGMLLVVELGVGLVIIALAMGVKRGAFAWKETKGVIAILATLVVMFAGGSWLIFEADESSSTEEITLQSLSILSAERLVAFWGDQDRDSTYNVVDSAEYFSKANSEEATDSDKAVAMFETVVRRPLVDMLESTLLAGKIREELRTWGGDSEPFPDEAINLDALSTDTKDRLARLAELYTGLYVGYDYHVDKPRSAKRTVKHDDYDFLFTMQSGAIDRLDAIGNGKEPYPAVKFYE